MLRIASLGVVLLSPMFTACWEPPPDDHCETAQELFGGCEDDSGGGGGGGGGGGYAIPPAFKPTYVPYPSCGGGEICPLAVGGSSMIHVASNDALDPILTLDGGPGRVSPWQTLSREQTYVLTSTAVPGDTRVTLTSDNYAPLERTLAVRAVRDVRFVSEYDYEPATANPAWRVGAKVTLGIFGDPAEVGWQPLRLVDSSLAVSHPQVAEVDWDRYVLPPATGAHTIEVTANSFGTRELTVDVVADIDRLDAVVFGTPATGHKTRVCFYGMAGAREVYTPVVIETSADIHLDRAHNCAEVNFPQGAWRRIVTARAPGFERTIELVIP